MDINTYEVLYTHDNYEVTSVMDGWLYGYDVDWDNGYTFYKMRPDGTKKSKCAPVSVAANGKLYYYERIKFNGPGERKLKITDVKTNKTRTVSIKGLVIDESFNASHDIIFVQDYETGELYTLTLDCKNLTHIPEQASLYGLETPISHHLPDAM